ncbi:MAG: OmpP1/FadL family transporter, partial [Bradymonadaceae bacterium]
MKAPAAILAMIFCLFWADQAVAGGFILPGRGVQPAGRGGALIAEHEGNLNSLWYNPANLALVDELTLSFDASMVYYNLEHQRAPRVMDNGDVRTYDAVSNEASPSVIPQILIGGPTGIDGLSWSAGFYTPYGGLMSFPEDGPQRYVIVDSAGSFMAYLHGAVGWQATDWLRVGAGIQNFMSNFKIVGVSSAYTGVFGDPEDEDL